MEEFRALLASTDGGVAGEAAGRLAVLQYRAGRIDSAIATIRQALARHDIPSQVSKKLADLLKKLETERGMPGNAATGED